MLCASLFFFISFSFPHSLSLSPYSRCGCVECFKDDLDHLFSVGFGVERGFGVEMRRLVRGDSQLVVEGVMPHFLHVIPVGDNAVLDGILERQNT